MLFLIRGHSQTNRFSQRFENTQWIPIQADMSPVGIGKGRGIPLINIDPKLLRMMFQNIISKAVKYNRIEGSLKIELTQKGDEIIFSVADSGVGIPEQEQSHIFTKLFRATNARESEIDGTGLGLYIVKSIVEQTGGSISFSSVEGKGTTFFLALPLSGMRQRAGMKTLSP